MPWRAEPGEREAAGAEHDAGVFPVEGGEEADNVSAAQALEVRDLEVRDEENDR